MNYGLRAEFFEYRFTEPDASLPPGAEVVTDPATVAEWTKRLSTEAARLGRLVNPQRQAADRRAPTVKAGPQERATDARERLTALEAAVKSPTRTRLVRIPV